MEMGTLAIAVMAVILFKTRVRLSKAALLAGAFSDFIFLFAVISRIWDGGIDLSGFFFSAAAFVALLVAVADGFLSHPRRRI
ncbi:MAG TPA: hypothetical protein VMU25_04880 [Candidatus Paceibacterota bacterium]|nr:hypothetical protein [Candidatus Paceibacterota bacterium]